MTKNEPTKLYSISHKNYS